MCEAVEDLLEEGMLFRREGETHRLYPLDWSV